MRGLVHRSLASSCGVAASLALSTRSVVVSIFWFWIATIFDAGGHSRLSRLSYLNSDHGPGHDHNGLGHDHNGPGHDHNGPGRDHNGPGPAPGAHSNHRPDHDAAVRNNHHHNLDDGGAEDGAQCLPEIAGDIHRLPIHPAAVSGEDARPVAIRRLVFGMTEVVACRRNHLPIQLTLRRSKTKQ